MNTSRKLLIASAATLVLASCSSEANTTGFEQVSLLSPVPPSVFFYPAFVADELGFFDEEKIDFTYENVGESVSMTSLLVNGQVDIATPGSAEALQALGTGQQFDIIYDYYTLSADAIGVLPDSDIQDLGQLKGGRIGIAADEVRSILASALDSVGLSLDDVTVAMVGTSGATIINSLQSGDIDAFVGSLLDFAGLEAAGVQLRNITPDSVAHLPAASFAVTPGTLESRGAAVEGFLRAWSKGLYAGMEYPELIEQVMRTVAPEEWIDPAAGAASLEVAMRLQDQSQQDVLGELQTANWQDAIDQAVQVGDLDAPLDPESFLSGDLLPSVNNFDRNNVDQKAKEYLDANA